MKPETIIHALGGTLAWVTLGVILFGIWKGSRRQVGTMSGRFPLLLRSAVFYVLASAIFLSLAFLGWKPLPWKFSPIWHVVLLAVGCVLYFPGMGLVLWGRLALGRNYYVSTGLGAQLFTDQILVVTGPYAIMRHPMYFGLMLASVGGLLIYATWTTAYFAVFAPFLVFRMRREEQALAAEFGSQWQEFSRRVPPLFPRFFSKVDTTLKRSDSLSRRKG